MSRGGKRPGAGRPPNPFKGKKSNEPIVQRLRTYDETVTPQAIKLCQLGATDLDLADFFGVAVGTIYRWKIEYPDFNEALKSGKAACDDRVERSLYHRAVGYSYDAVKVFNDKGAALIVPYREHVPPDTAAAFIWLKNRRKEEWRDKHEVSGEVIVKQGIDYAALTKDERDALRALLMKAKGEDGGERTSYH